MLVRKEIRIVALKRFLPEGRELEDWVTEIGRDKKHCNISYDHTNPTDKNCMIARLEGRAIGYVNAEDQMFVEPLLRHEEYAVGTFFEVYKTQTTFILRYHVKVDMNDVKRFIPGEAWKDWSYNGTTLRGIGMWSSIPYELDVMTKEISRDEPDKEIMDRYMQLLLEHSIYDMSYEITERIQNITYMLEMEHTEPYNSWKNRLQDISSQRRNMKYSRDRLADWWKSFLKSEECVRMVKNECQRLRLKHRITGMDDMKPVLSEYLDMVNDALLSLPYDLALKLDDFPSLYAEVFYTKIPREKLLQLLSALVMRTWLMQFLSGEMVDGKSKIIMLDGAEQMEVFGQYNNIHDNNYYN